MIFSGIHIICVFLYDDDLNSAIGYAPPFPLLTDTINPGLCENSPLPHNKKMFLAAGVAMPPYSGTTRIKQSELSKFFENKCSKDSRFLKDVGFVKDLNLVGKAKIIFFSNDTKKGSLLKFWNLNNSFRLKRTFQGLK